MPNVAKKARAKPRRKLPKKASAAVGRVRGHGAYTYDKPGPFGRIGRKVGELVGGHYGGAPGAALGGKLGSYAHYLGRIFGSGDYITNSEGIHSNSVLLSQQIPQFSGGASTTRIRHREYLGDVITGAVAGAFNITSYPLNPGQDSTFPWLSQVCGQSYQQYRINGMVFEFRSMSSDALNSTNTALGSVVMCTDYDSKDDVFSSKQQMENTLFGVSCKPSSCMIHAIECERTQTSVSELYIRANNVPDGADIRLYDLGRMSIATVGGQAANVNLGELWVSYDITLFKPIDQPAGFLVKSAHYQLNPDATHPVALLSGGTSIDNIGMTFPAGGLSVAFPADIPLGSWWLVYLLNKGTSTAAASQAGIVSSTGLVRVHTLKGNTQGEQYQPSPNTLQTDSVCSLAIYQFQGGLAPNALPTITWAAPATPLSAYSSGDLVITMLNSGWA